MNREQQSGAIEKRIGLTAVLLTCILYPIAIFTGFLGDLANWAASLAIEEAIFLMLLVIGLNIVIGGNSR